LGNEITITLFELRIGFADLEPNKQNNTVFPIKYFDADGTSNAKNFNLALLPRSRDKLHPSVFFLLNSLKIFIILIFGRFHVFTTHFSI